MKKLFFSILFFAAFLFLISQVSGATINLYTCAQGLSSNTMYVVNQSFNSSGQFCFSGGYSNVKVDCQGFLISYNGSGTNGELFYNQYSTNVTFQNCNISGFFRGVEFVLTNQSYVINSTFKTQNTGSVTSAIFYTLSNAGSNSMSSSCYLANNTITNGYAGIAFRFGRLPTNCSVIGNNFINQSSRDSILIDNESINMLIDSNSYSNWTGGLFGTESNQNYALINFTFQNNKVLDSGQNTATFLFQDLVNSTFQNNQIGNKTLFLNFTGASRYWFEILGANDSIFFNNTCYEQSGNCLFASQSGGYAFHNFTIASNYVNSSVDRNDYGLMVGTDGSGTPIATDLVYVKNNVVVTPEAITSVRHSYLIGRIQNVSFFNNTGIGGYYGVVIKSNNKAEVYSNNFYNNSNTCLFEKAGFNDVIYDNTCNQMNSEANVIQIGWDSTFNQNETNVTFYRNYVLNNSGVHTISVGPNSTVNIRNMTYTDPEYFSQTDSGNAANTSVIYRWWLYQANVTNSSLSPIANAYVTLYNNSALGAAPGNSIYIGGTLSWNLTTDSNGLTPTIAILDYINNGTKVPLNPYGRTGYANATIYANNDSMFYVNTTQNQFDSFILSTATIPASLSATNKCNQIITTWNNYIPGILGIAITAILILSALVALFTGQIKFALGAIIAAMISTVISVLMFVFLGGIANNC